jgi:hypothetical protein
MTVADDKEQTEPSNLVYTTKTGDEPKGGPSKTKEATEPLPPPEKRIAKKTVKKPRPRVKAKTEPLHKHIVVKAEVLSAAKKIIADTTNTYSRYEIRSDEEVVVR